MVVLALLLVAALVGGLLPQMEADAVAGSPAQARWLDAAHMRWGAWADRFAAWGLAKLYAGRAFHALLTLAAALAALWALRLWAHQWAALPRRAAARSFTWPGDIEDAWRKLGAALLGAGLSITYWIDRDSVRYALAERRGWGRWLPGLFSVGVILLLAAAPLSERLSWVGPNLDLVVGESQPLDHDSGVTVRLEQIELYPRADGSLQRFNSQLSLSQQSQAAKTVMISPGRRASYDGLSLYQVGYGPAARISARDAQDRPLDLYDLTASASPGRLLRVRFGEQQQERLLRLGDRDLIIRLVHYSALPAQGIAGRALHAQLLRGRDGQLIAEQFLASDGAVVVAGVRVDISFEYFVTVRAEREPELPVAGLGAVLIIIGATALAVWPPRTAWIVLCQGVNGVSGQIGIARCETDAVWLRRIIGRGGADGPNEEAHG